MCALFGWLDYKHIVPYKVLKKLTQALANAAEERGTDVAGISYIKVRFNIPENTVAVMGHARLATYGNQKFNQNNHPFYGHANKDFAFAHTGVLYNDTALRKRKIYQIPTSKQTAILQYSLLNRTANLILTV